MSETVAVAPVSVIVPTHDHADMLAVSVASVSAQTFADIEIVIVGDGVGDDTREVVSDLLRSDARIRFVDQPKSGRTGEPTRNRVLAQLESPLVAYHGDDDLMFADHLQTMVEMVEGYDFAHPLPVYVASGARLCLGHFDVSKRHWRDSMYPPMSRNVISLTGVMHTMESYRRLPWGWRATPPGIRTDHYMWQQYFDLPGFRGISGTRATTVKLAAVLRGEVSADQRLAEITRWAALIGQPGFQQLWDQQVARQTRVAWPRGAAITTLSMLASPGGPRWWGALQAKAMDLGRSAVPGLRTFPQG